MHLSPHAVKFKPMRRTGDLVGFKHGVVVGARHAGLNISETDELLGF